MPSFLRNLQSPIKDSCMFYARAELAPLLGSQVTGEQPGRCSFWAKVPRNHTGSSLSGPQVLEHPRTVVCVAGGRVKA